MEDMSASELSPFERDLLVWEEFKLPSDGKEGFECGVWDAQAVRKKNTVVKIDRLRWQYCFKVSSFKLMF